MDIKANVKTIKSSGLRNVFTPKDPINSAELLSGREDEVKRVVYELDSRAGHVLLFGFRGVGKTSVANIALDIACDIREAQPLHCFCTAETTFADMMAPLLKAAGYDPEIVASETRTVATGGGGLNLGIADASAKQQKSHTVTLAGARDWAHKPGRVGEAAGGLNAVFLIDEIDVVADAEVKRIAELIKMLSDYRAPLKLLLVGMAETLQKLAAGHLSSLRCLTDVELKKMRDDEIERIVTHGADKLGLNFAPSVLKKIVRMSSGFPHFTHLIALKLAEQAIADGRQDIKEPHLPDAISAARGDVEGALRNRYDDTLRPLAEKGRAKMIKILIAAATIPEIEIGSRRLREEYARCWGEDISKSALSDYLRKIAASNGSSILRSIAHGIYKFNDPRMPSYIKLANLDKLPSNGQRRT